MRNIDLDSGHPFVKVNHPAPGDLVNSPVHVAGYGTAFEGTIVVRVVDDSGKELGSAVMNSEGVMGSSVSFTVRSNSQTTPATSSASWRPLSPAQRTVPRRTW